MQFYTRFGLLVALSVGVVVPAGAQLFDKMAVPDAADTAPSVAAESTPAAAKATPAATADAVSELTRYIEGSKTLSGSFEQIVYSSQGEQASSGTFRLKRPDMFDWRYDKPYVQRIISDGKKVYHYDKDLEQITIRPRSELAGDAAMNLLVGTRKLTQSFKVQAQPVSKAPALLRNDEPGLRFFQLTPKKRSDDIDQVWLVMNDGAIAAVYVDSGVGQQSLIVLHNVKRNQKIANSAFRFTPPAGVDVIGG